MQDWKRNSVCVCDSESAVVSSVLSFAPVMYRFMGIVERFWNTVTWGDNGKRLLTYIGHIRSALPNLFSIFCLLLFCPSASQPSTLLTTTTKYNQGKFIAIHVCFPLLFHELSLVLAMCVCVFFASFCHERTRKKIGINSRNWRERKYCGPELGQQMLISLHFILRHTRSLGTSLHEDKSAK